MNKRHVLIFLFISNIIAITSGIYLKITHQEFSNELLIAGFGFSLAFVVLALSEVYRSQRIDAVQKLMWTVGLIFFHTIAALVYLLVGRQRVVNPMFLG